MEFKDADYYETNMVVLKKYHKSLWDRINNFQASCNIDVFYTAEGKPNLKVNQHDGSVLYLHDENDPEKEVPLFLDMIPKDSSDVILLTGIGLGYTPMAILKERKNIQYVAVFDLIPDIFAHALHYMDLTAMLADPRLILSIDPEPDIDSVLAPANLALQLENIHNLKHVPSFALDQEGYETLNAKVFTIANQYNLGGGAILGGGRVYTANRFNHLASMYKNNMLEALKGKFKDIPAVLVAGGPSLDMNIHLLPRLKNRAVVIAVDSALPALVANGVPPDFMSAIDPSDMIFEKFADALPEMEKTSLIASTWVASKVPKVFPPGQIFWTFSGRNMENWMMEMMGGTIPTGGASTVAHLNLMAAILMGCSPIVFVGQDLAYIRKVSHASNTSLTQNRVINNLLKSKDVLWTEEIHGGKVPTDRLFLNFKRHFEDLISNYPGMYINSTVQGARIKGTVPMDLEEVIYKYCSDKKNIYGIISSAGSSNKPSDVFLKEFRSFVKKSRVLFKKIDQTDLLQKKVVKTLINGRHGRQKYRTFNELPDIQKKQINEIDKGHKKIDSYKKIWGILDEMTMTGLQESERKKYEISRLEENPEKYTEWLLKNLERLGHINFVRKKELKTFIDNLSKLITHFEQENMKLNQIKKNKKTAADQIKLADFYFESGEFSLLEQVCLDFEKSGNRSSMIDFYKGCIALLKNQFEQAEMNFNNAEKSDPDIREKINNFRIKFGDNYLDHAAYFNGKDENTVRRLLIKGLKYSGENPLLANRINEIADADIKKSIAILESENLQEASELLEKWADDIQKNPVLVQALEKNKCAEFFRLYASTSVSQNKYEKAIKNFDKAIFYVDDNPEYYLLKADACFTVNDFDNGVVSLNQAVSLDKKYAQYWENMGDNLAKDGKFNDALAAYEQNMVALSDNRMILKKIAKCYLKLGQVEAANEALNQLKKIYK